MLGRGSPAVLLFPASLLNSSADRSTLILSRLIKLEVWYWLSHLPLGRNRNKCAFTRTLGFLLVISCQFQSLLYWKNSLPLMAEFLPILWRLYRIISILSVQTLNILKLVLYFMITSSTLLYLHDFVCVYAASILLNSIRMLDFSLFISSIQTWWSMNIDLIWTISPFVSLEM